MVAVQKHGVAFDLHDRKGLLAAIGTAALQLAAYFHAGGEVFAGNGLHQGFVAQAKGVFGWKLQGGLKAGLLPVQRGFNLGQGVAVAAVQVGHGLLGFFKEFSLGVCHAVLQSDDGVFSDFHGEWL